MHGLLKWHGVALMLGAACVVISVIGRQGISPLWIVGVVLIAAGVVMPQVMTRAQRPPSEEKPPVALALPVTGRWVARNGPATKVPSHTHYLAQTYAIDMTRQPAPDPVWLWPPIRRPEEYSAFGSPVIAPAGGRVVAAHGAQRDHRTRTSLFGVLYFMVEGYARFIGLPRHLLGNHVVLDLGDDTYAVLAHLRRGSVVVTVGDAVATGQQLAECGNSGNSTEPHLHFQLMDGPDITSAHGVRFAWSYRDDSREMQDGVPADGTGFSSG